MNEQEIAFQVDELFNIPFYLSVSAGILEFLATVLLFAGVIIIFTSSKRPGRLMMLAGVAFNTLSFLPYMFGESLDNLHEVVIWYLPLATGLFTCLGCFGFFQFALSFKKAIPQTETG